MPPKSRSARSATLLALLTLAYPLLHKPVSDVFDFASGRWGFAVYQRAMAIGIPVGCVLAVLPFIRVIRPALSTPRWAISLAMLAAATVASQHWLMVVNVELIHLPQFAIVSAAALTLGFRPHAAFLTGTASGIVDETYQHLVVYAGRVGTYFDINDIVLNALGAAWAVLLFARPGTGQTAVSHAAAGSRRWRLPLMCFGAAIVVASIIDPPVVNPLFQMTPASHKLYRVLSAPEGVFWCALLWIGVAAGIGEPPVERSRDSVRSAMTAGMLLALASTVMLQACAPARTVPSGSSPARVTRPLTAAPSSFITTFWCGPPLDAFNDVRAQEIADAGFTLVGSPCEGAIDPARNQRALDVAARHGLKLLVTDGRFGEEATRQPDWEMQVATAAAEYRNHPGFGGFFVTDEPSAAQFESLASITTVLQAGNRDLAYINLLPDYFPTGIGTPTYHDYVDRFVRTVRPRLLSYDHYPFRTNEDRPTFFANLSIVRRVALEHGLPFMLIVLAMPHGWYRDPTEAELSWQAFHALAFGARGLSYFAYWTPVNVAYAERFRFRHGLIEDGKPTRHYYEAQRLNRIARAIAEELTGFDSAAVADSQGRVAPPFPLGPITAVDEGTVTGGLFMTATGNAAVLLVNRDYRQPVTVRLRVRDRMRGERFVVDSKTWQPIDNAFRLPAGGAVLLRWPGSTALD